jgi:hypothetical protein
MYLLDADPPPGDNSAMSEHTHDTEQHVRRLAQALAERRPQPVGHIRRIVEIMGVEFADDLLGETQAVEAAGGLFLERENRRRTIGGVFFYLVRERLTDEQRRQIFPKQKQRPASKRQRGKRPAVAPLAAEALPEVIQALTQQYGKASTVKITVIGRPAQVVERGDVVIFGLLNEKQPALPKGLPAPPAQTKYLVLVAKKQWSKVAGVVKDAEDVLIIEGFPAYEPRHAGITVYALSVTTKKQQAAKRQEQKAEAMG